MYKYNIYKNNIIFSYLISDQNIVLETQVEKLNSLVSSLTEENNNLKKTVYNMEIWRKQNILKSEKIYFLKVKFISLSNIDKYRNKV